jgi:Spy/CpxP family protein refolding chaperone
MIRYAIPLLLLALTMGCTGPSQNAKGPQGPGPARATSPAQRLDKTMAELTKRLNLQPGQAEKVRAILKQEQKKIDQIPPGNPNADPRKEMVKVFSQIRQIEQETDQALSQVLTPEQMAGYHEYQEGKRKGLYRDRLDGFGSRKDKNRKPPTAPDGGIPRSIDPSRR